MTVTLIISAYNKPQYINLALLSLCKQTTMPQQVIIADDGSTHEVKKVVNKYSEILKNKCTINYLWQEDKGFRKAKIHNKAFAQATGQYIVCIDSDIIMDKHFIADHIKFAKENCFSCGGRVRIKKELTNTFLEKGNYKLNFLTKDIKNRLSAVRLPILTPLLYSRDHFRGCNIAFWKKDIVNINGYDERYEGYGLEDYDIVVRLMHSGVKKRFIRFAAIAYHLFHIERDLTHEERNRNQKLLDEAKNNKNFRAVKGMA